MITRLLFFAIMFLSLSSQAMHSKIILENGADLGVLTDSSVTSRANVIRIEMQRFGDENCLTILDWLKDHIDSFPALKVISFHCCLLSSATLQQIIAFLPRTNGVIELSGIYIDSDATKALLNADDEKIVLAQIRAEPNDKTVLKNRFGEESFSN